MDSSYNQSGQFIYSQLSSTHRQIRLLKLILFKTKACRKDPIRCALKVYDFEHAASETCLPPYIALSYTWGPSDGDDIPPEADEWHTIYVNGRGLRVRHNLYTALVELRRRSSSLDVRTFWIDAICINQQDDAERSAQVALMGSIFSTAQRVIVWLGEASREQTRKAVRSAKLAQKLSEDLQSEAATSGLRPSEVLRYSQDFLARCLAAGLEREDVALLEETMSIFEKRWWTRVWVVQEAALAEEIEIFWGRITLSWQATENFYDFVSATDQYTKWLNGATAVFDLEPGTVLADGWHKLLNGESLQTATGASTALLYLLHRTAYRNATNLRDRVYSILDLARHYSNGGLIPIIPDYDLTVPEVFKQVVDFAVADNRWLGFLLFVRENYGYDEDETTLDLPSFIPNFDRLAPLTVPDVASPAFKAPKNFHHKCFLQPREHLPNFDRYLRLLNVDGVCLGSIVATSERLRLDRAKDTVSLSRYTKILAAMEVRYRYTNQSRLTALCHTILEGSRDITEIERCESEVSCWFLWNMLRQVGWSEGQRIIADNPIVPLLDQDSWNDDYAGGYQQAPTFSCEAHYQRFLDKSYNGCAMLRRAMQCTSKHKCLFVTDKFHIGTCYQSASKGEHTLWLIARCPMAMVLRRAPLTTNDGDGSGSGGVTDKRYSVAGWAYVHGFHDGTVLDGLGDDAWQEIQLI